MNHLSTKALVLNEENHVMQVKAVTELCTQELLDCQEIVYL